MTTVAPPPPAESAAAAEKPAIKPTSKLAELWGKIEPLLDQLGDRLNPILVKEARQAMKSRQFIITFSLLLIFGWLWTVLFISFGVPAIFYAPVGPGVLTGYYVVLSIPLLIVVPYAAFRSLAAEREDGTYELLSITTLSARQIVLGKLGSALLQMMVYYSALAPCIAFTYLLRGIDVITIGLFLTYTFLASLLLSVFGLMMATVTRSRHWQVLLSVVFVMALLIFTFIWDMAVLGTIINAESLAFDNVDFWIANICVVSFYVPAVVLFILVAAGQITFASENRSTPIRMVLIVPQLLLATWMIHFWLRAEQNEVLYVFMSFGGIYWAVAGAFLTGEMAELSPRAMRRLPQSLLGRMAFTWFNPGSGTGYVFTVLNLFGLALVATLAGAFAHAAGLAYVPDAEWYYFTFCILGYVAGYLGLARILIQVARRFTPVGMLATFLCHVILITGGALFPLLIQAIISWGNYTSFEYSILQLPNWFWTLLEIVERKSFGGAEAAVIVSSVGLVIFIINVLLAAREVEHVRMQAPQRVLEDDAAQHPAAQPRKKSPWDE